MTLTGTLRKAFATTLAAAVLVGTLAGCSSNANSNASSNAKNSSDSSQTSATEIKRGESHDPSEEMADILWVLICLANQTGVDLTDALQKSFEKKTKRDKDRHKNNPKLKQ